MEVANRSGIGSKTNAAPKRPYLIGENDDSTMLMQDGGNFSSRE
jgi:hypothetical protein